MMPTKGPEKKKLYSSFNIHHKDFSIASGIFPLLGPFHPSPTAPGRGPSSNGSLTDGTMVKVRAVWGKFPNMKPGTFKCVSSMWCHFHLARIGLIESKVASREDFKGILFRFCQFYCTLYPASKNAQQISFVAPTMQFPEAKQECHVLVEYSHGQTIQTIAVYFLFDRLIGKSEKIFPSSSIWGKASPLFDKVPACTAETWLISGLQDRWYWGFQALAQSWRWCSTPIFKRTG